MVSLNNTVQIRAQVATWASKDSNKVLHFVLQEQLATRNHSELLYGLIILSNSITYISDK